MKISIITPCFNRASFITSAIESVMLQDTQDFEHIIMDGGSTDQTLTALSRYPHLRVFSKKDTGMYDALNKGLARAQGEIIGFLNSDDVYEPHIFNIVLDQFSQHPEADIVSGMASYFLPQSGIKSPFMVFAPVTQQSLERRLMYGVPIINAWFFRRSVFDRVGFFDQSYLIAADRDFQARCLIHSVKLQSVMHLFYHYCSHEESMTVNNDLSRQEAYLLENLKLAKKFSNISLTDQRLRKKFIGWQDVILFDLAISNFRRWNFYKAFEWIALAVKENPLRLIWFMLQFPLRLYYYLLRITKRFLGIKDNSLKE